MNTYGKNNLYWHQMFVLHEEFAKEVFKSLYPKYKKIEFYEKYIDIDTKDATQKLTAKEIKELKQRSIDIRKKYCFGKEWEKTLFNLFLTGKMVPPRENIYLKRSDDGIVIVAGPLTDANDIKKALKFIKDEQKKSKKIPRLSEETYNILATDKFIDVMKTIPGILVPEHSRLLYEQVKSMEKEYGKIKNLDKVSLIWPNDEGKNDLLKERILRVTKSRFKKLKKVTKK